MPSRKTEKRRRQRQRQAERARMVGPLTEACNGAADTIARLHRELDEWQNEYFALGERYGLGIDDQAQRERMLHLEAVPPTPEAFATLFMGLNLFQWSMLPPALTDPFQLTDAVAIWRAQMVANGAVATRKSIVPC